MGGATCYKEFAPDVTVKLEGQAGDQRIASVEVATNDPGPHRKEGKVQSDVASNKRATIVVTKEQAHRRAGGRRAYNRMRQFRANHRLMEVAKLMRQMGLERGWQTRIANALGVSRSTICRDFQRLRRRARFGLESDKFARGLALVAKHARDDARADREYEARKKAASSDEVAAPDFNDEFAVPENHDKLPPPPVTPRIPVPTWLPDPRQQTAIRSWRPMPVGPSSRHLRRR
jgi:hypothetical protein